MERLQILVTADQRRRLERAAAERATSVTSVVRAAIDEHVPVLTREERREALAWLRNQPPVRYVPPDELREMLDSQFDEDRTGEE